MSSGYKNGGDWRDIFAKSGIVVIDEDAYERAVIERYSRGHVKMKRPLSEEWKPQLYRGMPVVYIKSYGPIMRMLLDRIGGKR